MEILKGDYNRMKSDNNYTIDDIFALPENVRAELYDGELVMLAAPTTIHQLLLGWFHFEIAHYIWKKGGNCLVLPAPFGVSIGADGAGEDVVIDCTKKNTKKVLQSKELPCILFLAVA